MNPIDLKSTIERGETSSVQFKLKIASPDALACELAAFANSFGGMLIIGVEDKTGSIEGLTNDELHTLNNLLSNVAQNNIKPPINYFTENIKVEDKVVLIVQVIEGLDKPYTDNKGVVWVKNGADKRKVTDKHEYARLLQQGRNLFADELPVQNAGIDEIDKDLLDKYFKKQFETTLEEFLKINQVTFQKIVGNLHLTSGSFLNLGALLLFGKNPERFKPAFIIKAVSFFGNDIAGTEYRDSEDIAGNLYDQFTGSMLFLMRNLKKIQKEQNFNSLGVSEVSKTALEELVQNALIHRDYFKNAPVRILMFENRIEIISPGRLPNSLTVENIILGNTVIRNNLITSFAARLLPYRGLGSGIRRALKEQPGIRFYNDVEGDQFMVTVPRPPQG